MIGFFLFHSEKLHSSEWIAHPKNPVVSDVTKSRPAGNIFNYNGKLIRPSQNSAKRYGYGIVYNEILILNEKIILKQRFLMLHRKA